MLDRPHRQGLALPWKAVDDMMAGNGSDTHQDKARRFRDAALPHLDDVYTLARYLLRDSADAEDAAQECYLRGLRYFRHVSRHGDQTVALRNPAQHLSRRIRASIPRHARDG